MEIKQDDYRIHYDPAATTVTFAGMLRLSDSTEYAPITQLLNDVLKAKPPRVTLNVQALEFLNSAGINIIYQFVFKLRDQGVESVIVRGAKQITWQARSLPTLRRMVPEIQLELV